MAALAPLEMVQEEAARVAVIPAEVEPVQADRAAAARVVDQEVGDPEVGVQEVRGLAERNRRQCTTPHPWMGSCLLIVVIFIPVVAIVIIGIVAVVAGQTGRAVQRLGMAILA